MKGACLICLFLICDHTLLFSQSNPLPPKVPTSEKSAMVVPPVGASQPTQQAQARILDSYGKLPLTFEANQGQADAQVKFLSRTGAYTIFLTGDEALLALLGRRARKNLPQKLKPASLLEIGTNGAPEAVPFLKTPHARASGTADSVEPLSGGVLRMKLRNANPRAQVTGEDKLAGSSSYFLGNDPAKWRTNVATYTKVKYEGIYSGIDLVYYGNQHQLEYDFIVAPGADPRRIAFDVRGAKWIRRTARGDLSFILDDAEIRWRKPVVYQEQDGTGSRWQHTTSSPTTIAWPSKSRSMTPAVPSTSTR
jgi:hypothetical protein